MQNLKYSLVLCVLIFSLYISAQPATVLFAEKFSEGVVDFVLDSSCAPLPSDLIGWYPAEGSADDLVDCLNGTLMKGASLGPGLVGQAFDLDGVDDYVEIDSVASQMAGLTEFTIEFWVKAVEGLARSTILGIHDSNPVDPNVLRILTESTNFLRLSTNTMPQIITSFDVLDDAWHHIVYSRDGSVGYLWADGILLGSHTISYSFDASYRWSIGQDYDGVAITSDFLTGKVDEFTLYAKALTNAEIQSIYNAGALGKCFTVCECPINLSSTINSATSVVLSWGAVSTATGYLLKGRKIGSPNFAKKISLTNSKTINFNFDIGEPYEWKVASYCGGDTSGFTSLENFVVDTGCTQIPSDAIAWYPAEGDANNRVDGGLNGSLVNGAGFGPGLVGQAFNLDGTNQYVDIDNLAAVMDGRNQYSIEMWVNADITAQSFDTISKMFLGVNTSGGNVLWLGMWSNEAVAGPAGYLLVFTDPDRATGSFIGDGLWHHVALVRNDSLVEVYLDGTIDLTMMDSSSFSSSDQWSIGQEWDTGSTSGHLNGKIDELAIYTRALSVSEIQAIYNAGVLGKCDDFDTLFSSPDAERTELTEKLTIVYPNPVSKTLHIRSNNAEEVHFEFVNSLGKILFQGKSQSGHFELDVQRYASGIYYVHLLNDEAKLTYPVCVE